MSAMGMVVLIGKLEPSRVVVNKPNHGAMADWGSSSKSVPVVLTGIGERKPNALPRTHAEELEELQARRQDSQEPESSFPGHLRHSRHTVLVYPLWSPLCFS